MTQQFKNIGVIGAGAMGRGIAQMAAQAGSEVWLVDAMAGAAQKGCDTIRAQWAKLAEKGRITTEQAEQWGNQLHMAENLQALAPVTLVIEAIIEQLEAKQALVRELDAVLQADAVIATNTSSLSVSALAQASRHPQRVVGLHFFNPVPLMKVVEVIRAPRTAAGICEALSDWVRAMGHTPVQAQDTPGFIVNHAGRGYVTEALRLLQENVADVQTIDRILRDQVGFKLGPFELLDLTGLDVSHPVMESIYRQYFDEPRYRPSAIAAQRMTAGLLGRKSSEGFYHYGEDGKADVTPEAAVPAVAQIPPVWVSSRATRRAEIYQLLKDLGAQIETAASPSPQALIVVAPLGFDVTTVAVVERLDPARTVGLDMLLDDASTRRRVLATNPATRADMRDAAHALFARDGKPVSVIRDSGGFVTQRVLGTIVNIASDMCQQAVCTPEDLDTAVRLGLGYPEGPLALGNRCGPTNILEVLFNLQTVYGDTRYRPSPWLRRRGAIGLSLLQREGE